jgi:hypothetical protein
MRFATGRLIPLAWANLLLLAGLWQLAQGIGGTD